MDKLTFKVGDRVRWDECEIDGPSTGQTEPIPAGVGKVVFVHPDGDVVFVWPDDVEIRRRIEDIWSVDSDDRPEFRGALVWTRDESDFCPTKI